MPNPMPRRLLRPPPARAASLVEALVAIAVVVVAAATLAPVVGRHRSSAGEATSIRNLIQLGQAHACYAGDWNDRQFVAAPDDLGVAGGSCAAYNNQFGCIPPLLLGWDPSSVQTLWGYYLGCGSFPGSCINMSLYKPIDFDDDAFHGTWRLGNAKSMAEYVDGRFYDPTFYAPDDLPTFAAAKPFFDIDAGFAGLVGGGLAPSSYVLSPAAMYHPDVLRRPSQGGFQDPDTLDHGYAAPTVGQALHPSLKTRLIEHFWVRNAPAPCHPTFDDPFVSDFSPNCSPYLFSHGLGARPLALFFDGGVARLATAQAVQDDEAVLKGTGGIDGLWSRDTPFGADGYQGALSFDGTKTGHHLFTTDGILGRDRLR